MCCPQFEKCSFEPRWQDLCHSEHMAPFLRRRPSDCFNASLLQTQFPSLSLFCLWVLPPSSSHCGSNSKPLPSLSPILSLSPSPSGYTVTWLYSRGLTSLLAAGAPRYQHVGRVVLFQESKDKEHWSQIQKIDGNQVSMASGASADQGLV